MDQNDLQHIAMTLLEFHINLGRAIRENARLAAEIERLRPQPEPPLDPQGEKKEG